MMTTTNTAEWKTDLFLDGYISQTLTPLYTERYIKLFIKCLEKERRGSFVAFDGGWVVARSSGNGYEMFDRKVDLQVGTIVPQPTWIGVSEKTGVLCPIFFVQRNGALGIPYQNPAPFRSPLHNAKQAAPALLRRENQNVRMRVQWPGYEEFHYEFRILDRKLGKYVPITMSRLVERVMRGIHRLYSDEGKKRDPKTFAERWKLGEDGIQLDEINLIGLLQISKGTWMPILQLARHIIPRWDWLQDSQKKQSEVSEED